MDTAKRLLEIIDFDYPGLEDARTAYKEGDCDKAIECIVEHFRTRKDPKYLFRKEDTVFLDDPRIFEDAEKTMNHYIFSHQFGEDIDFAFNPTAETSRDNEWTWSLYRTLYWQPLARAYALTGDDRYVREFAKQLKKFYQTWPAEEYMNKTVAEIKQTFPGNAWRTIETAMRIYTTWLPLMEICRNSEAFDIETWTIFLSSVHDHAEFLLGHFSNHTKSSNWLSMECSGLLQMGIMFPEFRRAKLWKDTAYRRVMHEVAYCFDEDGIHMERTPIYHMVASIAFLQSVLLCRKNGIYVPDYAMAKIEKSAEFLMDITKPDFSTPMLGDADRNDFLSWKADTSVYEGMNLSFFPDDMNEIRAYFALMANLTGREDFRYVATGGKEGKAPEKNESKFSDGGIYVFRTGFGKEDYLMTQMVRLESGEVSSHSHNDTGHVELMLGGEDILIDCGRYIYNSSIWKDWRHYFLSAKAHNTFYCDDHYNGEIEEFPKRRGVRGTCHKFESTDRYKIVDISHNGFAYLDDPVFHRRACILLPEKDCLVVIDKVTGLSGADHDMRFYWNFATDNGEADEAKAVYTAPSGKRYELEFFSSVDGWKGSMLIGSEDPKGGWVSYGYPVRKPIAQYCVSRMGKAPFVMATVIKKEGTECSVSFDEGRIRIDGIQIAFDDKGVEVL